jgi:hypothetical protein
VRVGSAFVAGRVVRSARGTLPCAGCGPAGPKDGVPREGGRRPPSLVLYKRDAATQSIRGHMAASTAKTIRQPEDRLKRAAAGASALRAHFKRSGTDCPGEGCNLT